MTYSAFGKSWITVKPEDYSAYEKVTLYQKTRNGMLPYKLAGNRIPIKKIKDHKTPPVLYVSYEERLAAYEELSHKFYDETKQAIITRDKSLVTNKVLGMVEELFEDPRAGSALLSRGVVTAVVEEQMNDRALIELFVRISSINYTAVIHSVHVMGLLLRYGHYKNFDQSEIERLGRAGLVHDIGKSELPKELWIKTSQLTDEEFRMVKQHPIISSHILRMIGMKDVVDAAEQHHEKLDGSGYPYKLKKDKITNDGRIVELADCYEVLTSYHRVNRDPVSSFDALAQMREEAREGKLDFDLFTDFARSFVK